MYTSLDTQGRLSARLLSAQARSACLFFLLLLLFYSQGAYAHGVAEGDKGYIQEITGINIIPFIYLGAKHMVTGYDHLLFLFGVIFFLYKMRDIGLYVSLFAIGHSTTLLIGTFFDISVSAYLIDAIIGLSVVYKALDNLGAFQRWFGVNLIVSRKMVVTMGALLMIGPGMIGLFTSPYIAIALLCVGGFAHQALSGALITLSSDVFGRNEVATANGLTGMSAWLASTLFALVVGALADTIGFSPLFAVLAVFDLLGALVIWTVLQNKSASEVESESQTGDPAAQS